MALQHPVDITAAAGFIAAGGLAGVAGFFAIVDPAHAPIYTAGAIALTSIAGLVRVIFNPTPAPGSQAVTEPTPKS